ncbi:hypothetical protein [Falsigemmobacter faecalis]|uniref:Uncharacterized protein n=1 Tax=Falsigemmobacter faecalis TaxID=2488730 RepID=A0A3P3D3L7_9RHOB|nr:hypothetical protein [Falsigemmobacter faecalis]RRH68364.1 hypothetical protein EG244_19290 [Falsigemmobacter faecalis]
MIRKLWQGLIEDSLKVSIAPLCAWFSLLRSSTKSALRVNPELAVPIRKMIDDVGYRPLT